MDANDGGPAFPVVHAIIPQQGHFVTAPPAIHGMSLRDWFAGQVLMGFAAHQNNHSWTRKQIAQDCYDWAEAMIAERKSLSEQE